jgi:hypothetical protein
MDLHPIYYRAKGFQLNVLIEKDWLFYTNFESNQRYLKIAFFMVEPKNKGMGTLVPLQHKLLLVRYLLLSRLFIFIVFFFSISSSAFSKA